jgi:Family of unknown function (DUF6035)
MHLDIPIMLAEVSAASEPSLVHTDENPSQQNKRRISEVLELATGNEIKSIDFFKKPEHAIFTIRRKQEQSIQEDSFVNCYVCYYCNQIVKIKGKPQKEGKTILYFAHLKDSLDCAIKTDGKYSKEEIQRMKYNGAKESVLHRTLKTKIAAALEANEKSKNGVLDVKVEKWVQNLAISKEWKKPDVQCHYRNQKMVFELQLSTTFLSVIVQREAFYKQHQTFILWVFSEFNLEEPMQKFTQKDILYSNNRNAFIFSDAAQRKSEEANDLILQCYYIVPRIDHERIDFYWEIEYVRLLDLTFDVNEFKVYYFDSETAFRKLEIELNEIIETRLENEQKIKEKEQIRKSFFSS